MSGPASESSTQRPVVLGIVAGPEAGGRTATAVAGVLAGAEKAGATTSLVELSEVGVDGAIAALAGVDAVVFGSPVYRATYSALLKDLLERIERGKWGESTAPLQGTVAATVLTGASPHHFLATGDLDGVLSAFFAVQVLSPGLYLDQKAYVDRSTLTEDGAGLTGLHGAALADLATAVRGSSALQALRPLA